MVVENTSPEQKIISLPELFPIRYNAIIAQTGTDILDLLQDKGFHKVIQKFHSSLLQFDLPRDNRDQLVRSAVVVYSLLSKLPEDIKFHSIAHTFDAVIPNLLELLIHEELESKDDVFFLVYCALFHDTGYDEGGTRHEERSSSKAVYWKNELGIHFSQELDDDSYMHDVIMATKVDFSAGKGLIQSADPYNLHQQYLCDADLMHLVKDDFVERADKMRSELAEKGKNFSDAIRRKEQIALLENRQFYLPYTKHLFDEKPLFDDDMQATYEGYRQRWLAWYRRRTRNEEIEER